jgi:hypothetical protein
VCRPCGAGTCCCAFERELQQRRLEAARDIVLKLTVVMRRWQDRQAAALHGRVQRRLQRATLLRWQKVFALRKAHRALLARHAKSWRGVRLAKAGRGGSPQQCLKGLVLSA